MTKAHDNAPAEASRGSRHGSIIREGEVNFAKPLPRALLRDRRLSWGGAGNLRFPLGLSGRLAPTDISPGKHGHRR